MRARHQARRALDQTSYRLARAPRGARNQELNRSAYRAGRMVGAGWLERAEAERALFEASIANGLVGGDGAAAVRSTIASGLAAGVRAPAQHPLKLGAPPHPPPLSPQEAQEQTRKVNHLWRQGVPVEGTPAERYLRARAYNGAIPRTFRYLPSSGDHPHALLVPFGIPREPGPGVLELDEHRIAAVQLTKIAPDGSDRVRDAQGKITVGRGSSGCPLCISPVNDGLGLAICEGVEDGFSIYEALGLGVWASGGSGRMRALADAVPGYVEVVSIFQHPDAEDDVANLAMALQARGFEVLIKEERDA